MIIGLTGSVGSGKSTVAGLLAARGAAVIDTDVIARDVSRPGGRAHAAIVARFGEIDRRALADLVFSDPDARRDLNAIVHPAVAAVVDEQVANTDAPVVVLVVPLLVEAGWTDKVDRVVVVDTPEDLAVERVVRSGRLDEPDARRRVATQASRAERLAYADTVITNDGGLDELEAQVDALWEEARRRSDAGRRSNADRRLDAEPPHPAPGPAEGGDVVTPDP